MPCPSPSPPSPRRVLAAELGRAEVGGLLAVTGVLTRTYTYVRGHQHPRFPNGGACHVGVVSDLLVDDRGSCFCSVRSYCSCSCSWSRVCLDSHDAHGGSCSCSWSGVCSYSGSLNNICTCSCYGFCGTACSDSGSTVCAVCSCSCSCSSSPLLLVPRLRPSGWIPCALQRRNPSKGPHLA